jgi:hypothetical protein
MERSRVAAFASSGICALVGAPVLADNVRSAGAVSLRHIVSDFVLEEPWVLETDVFSLVVGRALEFIHDIATGIQQVRSENLRTPLAAGGYFDPDEKCLISEFGETIPLTPREASVVSRLVRHGGRFRSAAQLAGELSDLDDRYVDAHAIEVTISRLRASSHEQMWQAARRS